VKWYGGDFIAGSENFFHILHTKTKKYQEKFIKLSKKFSNYTDEFFLTAAILDIEKNENYKMILRKVKYGDNENKKCDFRG
jgi:hypothetical protein